MTDGSRRPVSPGRDVLHQLRSVQVFDLDGDGTVLSCNEAACEGLGLPRARVLQQGIQEFLVEPDAETLGRFLQRGGGAEQPIRLNFTGASHLPYTLDSWIHPIEGGWLLVGESPGTHDQRMQRQLMEVNQELAVIVRERAKAVQSERQARHAANQANRAKDNTVATIVHELRQPLGPMRLAIELIRKATDAEPRARALNILDRQIGHLTRLFQDLLDASRIQQGKLSLKVQAADLAGLVREVADGFRRKADASGIALSVSVPPAPLVVPIDATRLTQVVSNLIENALKFSSAGGQVDVALVEQPDTVQVSIRDRGRGIDPSVLPHIFELFAQQRRGEGGGLGIGLAIALAIVTQHRGRIEVRSEGVNQGAEFIISLPGRVQDPAS